MYQHGGDIYRNQNMMDFSANVNWRGMPASVREAAIRGIDCSEHYPDTRCEALKEAIAKKDGILQDYIFCGNGAADVIFALVLAMKPKKALLPIPSFYEYRQALDSVGCEIVDYRMTEASGFSLDEGILDAITEEIDVLFLCNPNNPTGQLIETSMLIRILQKCRQNQVRLILDECFNEFLDEPSAYTMIPSLAEWPELFVLKAFTKMYAMPGLRLGYGLCADERFLHQMERCVQPWRVSLPAQLAGVAACKETAFVEESRIRIQAEKKRMYQRMAELGVKPIGSMANYLFFKGPEGLYDKLKEKGFLIRDCGNYPGLVSGYYRIAVRETADNDLILQAISELL